MSLLRRELIPLAALAACIACGQSSAPSKSNPASPRPTARASSTATAPAPQAQLSGPANLDVRAARGPVQKSTALAALGGRRASIDPALGVPAFLWGDRAAPVGVKAGDAVAAARAHLGQNGAAYALRSSDVSAAKVVAVHDTGRGAIIVKLRQELDGVELFRDEASVAMDRELKLVAISGSLAPVASRRTALAAGVSRFRLDARGAIAAALSDLTGQVFGAGDVLPTGTRGKYTQAALAAATSAARPELAIPPARAKQVWFREAQRLVPAWYVEVGASRAGRPDSLQYAYVVSADDAAVLFRKNQVSHAPYRYRVWADPTSFLPDDGPQGLAGTPHPTGLPDGFQADFVPQALVEVDEVSATRDDPWLPADAATASGNNAFAYADLGGADGYDDGVDLPGLPSAAGVFDYPYDFGEEPYATEAQVQAAVAQLFYDVNFFHDWYYDSGFTEEWATAQASNHGRGGEEGDAMRAEAQDFSGLDNANMWTPSDGLSPRMQMYLFTGNGAVNLQISAPAAIAGTYPTGYADYGPQSFDLTGEVAYAVDGAAPTGDACTALTNVVTGKIVLVDRGACNFTIKVQNAINAGAAGVLIRNNVPGALIYPSAPGFPSAIPILSLTQADGAAILAQLAIPEVVTVRMVREAAQMRDGTLDNLIVAHEWGHYISNRLVGNGAGLDTNQSGGLGEGWGDIHALLLAVREEDAEVAANEGFGGVYGMAGFVMSGKDALGGGNQGYYFGIRRVPYSTDLHKNPLTFRHIADGEAIPAELDGVPIPLQLNGVPNSEVHNTGEVWATMLWECYAALLRDTDRLSFAQAQGRFKDYLVAAYKLLPANPTLLDARDGMLAAALANDPADYELFWQAFAKRGAGKGAVGPDAYSEDNLPVAESFEAGPDLEIAHADFGAVSTTCDDADGTLDSGEAGTLTLHLANTGAQALEASTATIAADVAGLTFPDGDTVQVPATAAGATAEVQVRVALEGVTAPTPATLTLTFPDGFLLLGPDVTTTVTLHQDTVRDASRVDEFEAGLAAWTTEEVPARVPTWGPDAGYAFAPDNSVVSDISLVSPVLYPTEQPLVVSFLHTHLFEFAGYDADEIPVGYDGGVVELRELDAQGEGEWVDAGAGAYNGWLIDGGLNPLELRDAFVYVNPSFPDLDLVQLDLGTAYAGKAVQLRFRIGTDIFTGSGGWILDWVGVEGIANTPFPIQSADARRCENRQPVADAGAAQDVDEGALATLDGSASSDPDGTALTFAWTQLSGVTVTLAGADTSAPTFTAPAVSGDSHLVFQLTVSDGALSSTSTTAVTILNLDQAPVADAGDDQTVDERKLVVLDATGSSDPDGTALQYAWVQTAGPTVTLSGAATPRPSFTAPAVGSTTALTFQVTVSDGTLTATDTVSVSVKNTDKSGGCTTAPGAANPALLLLLAVGALLLPRRRATR
ncbi:MAG: myxosortase-dependent M36 family metallopeptidase [Anaeromyxobacter sp.]